MPPFILGGYKKNINRDSLLSSSFWRWNLWGNRLNKAVIEVKVVNLHLFDQINTVVIRYYSCNRIGRPTTVNINTKIHNMVISLIFYVLFCLIFTAPCMSFKERRNNGNWVQPFLCINYVLIFKTFKKNWILVEMTTVTARSFWFVKRQRKNSIYFSFTFQ